MAQRSSRKAAGGSPAHRRFFQKKRILVPPTGESRFCPSMNSLPEPTFQSRQAFSLHRIHRGHRVFFRDRASATDEIGVSGFLSFRP